MIDKYAELTALSGFSFPVYASAGTEVRAREIAKRCEQARHTAF